MYKRNIFHHSNCLKVRKILLEMWLRANPGQTSATHKEPNTTSRWKRAYGCLPQISTDFPTHMTCRKCLVVVWAHHINKLRENVSSSPFACFPTLSCTASITKWMGEKISVVVQSVILVQEVSSAAKGEFIEHASSVKPCASDSWINIDRNKVARAAHAQA